ncbi:tetratricopeptide repeat protein [Pseudomonas sp. BN417]|uniref:tetratricopeptide repeat protein n=1 Tax=Pseudomonas sp. BN417 TaxID=2567890 RepID=UPI0024561B3F|nr:tetratricopeptide repeat protein [Pseudomonas sp. BN417]MDH4553836.1 tetratricopeptide repeat protein [Pseudomonas sp. BN417]
MKAMTLRQTALLVLVCISVSRLAFADGLDDSVTQAYFNDILKECDDQLSEWRRLWRIEIGLAVFILVLGALSAAIQNFSFQSVKVITVVCGVLISITTGIVSLVGLDNHRSLSKSIESVEYIVLNMKRKVKDYGMFKAEDKQVPLNEFYALYAKFKKIQDPDLAQVVDRRGRGVIGLAYAGDDVPTWVRSIPEDSRNLYFVGVADGPDLRDAQDNAKKNAIQSASRFLAGTLNASNDQLDSVRLATDLSASAEVVDSHVVLDEQSGIYRYYSLLRVNKSLAEAGTKLFATQRGINAPQGAIQAIADSQRKRDDYSSRQLVQYEALLDKTSSLLSPEEYREFAEARQLRKAEGNNEKAIAMLKGVLEKKPGFYLGWYNIALAYSAAGNSADARNAYDKAVALEPMQPLRDGTVYNSYGHFLLKQRQFCDAQTKFEKAVALDPLNPRAINNLALAKRKLQESGTGCN